MRVSELKENQIIYSVSGEMYLVMVTGVNYFSFISCGEDNHTWCISPDSFVSKSLCENIFNMQYDIHKEFGL